ncbi:MAG: lysophospholipid acyltransferase family protein [Myxococcota bacterium]
MIYVLRYLLVALCTVFWGTFGLIAFPLARRGEVVMFVARRWVSWMLACCGIRVEADGLDNLTEPVVIMSNHQSVFDIAALIHTLPLEWRFVAKKELLWIPFFGWALAAADQVIIDRSDREKSVRSLRRGAERVRGGINVIIFPEGTRSQEAALGPFKSGGFHLALQAGVPVIPVSVSGSSRITPKHSLRIESGTIRVHYGKGLPTAGLGVEARSELKERVREAIVAGFDPEL